MFCRVALWRSPTALVFVLLGLSWLFYAWHVPSYIVLIVLSTVIDYLAALRIERLRADGASPRGALVVSLVLNLGLLAYFKYAGFLVAALPDSVVGAGRIDPILPIGISFYTFQSVSYTIDVYRGDLRAESSFVRFACYVAFFPQLVAGPIVRAGDFLYQLRRRRKLRGVVFAEGAYLIVRGLFLKAVLADNLGTIVDSHWAAAAEPQADGVVAIAVLTFFAAQLFCDFAGYTDIARGVAYHLGFRLPINFDAPYLATTFTSFWRRWHITLSTWFRDYVYIPLGGNRAGNVRSYANLIAVMLIAGLWHGANWTFVIWGAVHGFAIALERLVGLTAGSRNWWVSLAWYVLVQATWVLSMGMFRADDVAQGRRIIGNALGVFSGAPLAEVSAGTLGLGWLLLVPVVALHVRSWLVERALLARPGTYERALYAGAMAAAFAMAYSTSQQFIYFQF